MTDEVTILRDRSNEVLDPWASDRLLRQGGAALVTRRTADNQAIAVNMARVSTRIIDEARADGIAARRQRTTVVGAVGAGLIGAAAVALLIAARLSWRTGRLASVAEAVSSGRLNGARINDRGTDGIAVPHRPRRDGSADRTSYRRSVEKFVDLRDGEVGVILIGWRVVRVRLRAGRPQDGRGQAPPCRWRGSYTRK